MTEQPICELYHDTAVMALSHRTIPIADIDGCWEHQINDEWWVAANGHKEPAECSKGTVVPAFHFYFERNGWPVALVGPYGGTVLGSWDDDTFEDQMIEVVRAATVTDRLTPSEEA